MNRYWVFVWLVLFPWVGKAQIDSILAETLTDVEVQILNERLNKDKYDFDFSGKKVAFFSSPGGVVMRSKKDYFYYDDQSFSLVFFTEKQKSKHGYDVAVVYISKNAEPNISNRLKRYVRRYNRKNHNNG